MALKRSLLRIDKASLLETFRSLKIKDFGYTPSCLQLLRKSMFNFSLFFLYSNSSFFRKSLTVAFPYFRAISLQIFIIFLDTENIDYIGKFLSPFLCGYKKGFSTQYAFLTLIGKWKFCLDKQGFPGALLMDLSKAFDTINHQHC